MIVHLRGEKSHEIVEQGLRVLENMRHRGAEGADNKTGDGAGILLQIPHEFILLQGIPVPEKGKYGTGIIFLPKDEKQNTEIFKIIKEEVEREGLKLSHVREVPVNPDILGDEARAVEPLIRQIFITGDNNRQSLELKLYILRRRIENRVSRSELPDKDDFYVTSLSTRVILYKGMLETMQLRQYYPDLTNSYFTTGLALVHSRFSTNTFPRWSLAQPFRLLAHNGEINTVRGNRGWMEAREGVLKFPTLKNLDDIRPIIQPGMSDSASLDNVLEFLTVSGMSLPHAMAMLIPESFNDKNPISDELKAFFEYHSILMEPWDGPAALLFTDGRYAGGMLDRNGLRPSRYLITKNDVLISASETGVVDVEPENIKAKGRLQPGKIMLVDTMKGKLLFDNEIKEELANAHPYGKWLTKNRVELDKIHSGKTVPNTVENYHQLLRLFDYTREDVERILTPMATTGAEPVGSMGFDVPLAALSDRPQLLFNYFRQQFAQVTNPPIDPYREELVMSLEEYIGAVGNDIMHPDESHCKMVRLPHPILTNNQLDILCNIRYIGFKCVKLSTLYEVDKGREGMEKALDELCRKAAQSVEDGVNYIILTDRYNDFTACGGGFTDSVSSTDSIASSNTIGRGGSTESIASSNTIGGRGNSIGTAGLAPIPALLAVSAVHHYLISVQKRVQTALIVESGEMREVMHAALLLGYGASALNPYMAFATLKDLIDRKELQLDFPRAESNYIKALGKGLLKIISKMGISTIRSYRGAKLFESVGISDDVCNRYFGGATGRIGGVRLDEIARDVKRLHARAFGSSESHGFTPSGSHGFTPSEAVTNATTGPLPNNGLLSYRKDGEAHAWNPETIATLQLATRTGSYAKYKEYSRIVGGDGRDSLSSRETISNKRDGTISNERSKPIFLRDLMSWRRAEKPIPIEEVEPASAIMRRFVTGAMSYGSISREAHETLAMAMNYIHGRSNTGEGGEDPDRFKPREDGLSLRSAIKQVASGRFGVTAEYLVNADEIQIKIAQGAKPGEGGQLPGHKVDKIIARTRHSIPGISLISPPPHHDIYSIEDLAQLIFDLKNVNPRAEISVKLVAETGVGTIAAGVAKAKADRIIISGADGGTGASPLSSIRYAGIAPELGLSETQQTLVLNNLRGQVRLQTDGQIKTGRDIVLMAMLGAEEYGFATSALIVLGCVMMRKCHLNTCPVGVATQDPELRKRFMGKYEYLVNFFNFLAEEVREILAEIGVRSMDEIIGRADLIVTTDSNQRDSLSLRETISNGLDEPKWTLIDLRNVTYFPKEAATNAIRKVTDQLHRITDVLDRDIIARTETAIAQQKEISLEYTIANTDRATGAMLSGFIAQQYGDAGLPDNTVNIKFKGSAGQSFGAFLARGVNFRLEGDANDYLGKGLSGGRISVLPPSRSTFVAHENTIAGNTLLYGATNGEVYINGRVGERFCVRNSGAIAVVEGAGDHCCEYMTGGRVVVLGETGRNFAAGMSGGVAYVWNKNNNFYYYCNMEMVELSLIEESPARKELHELIRKHYHYTGSAIASDMLDNWERYIDEFIMVVPIEYKKVLQEEQMAKLQRKIEEVTRDY